MRLHLDPEDVAAIADAVVDRLRAGDVGDWIDQTQSELGPRKHCAAVRRRMAKGEGGASKVGRRHLLSKDAHAEEIRREGGRAPSTLESKIADELGLRLVGGNR